MNTIITDSVLSRQNVEYDDVTLIRLRGFIRMYLTLK